MSIQTIDVTQPAAKVVQKVVKTDHSILLIPPKLKGKELNIEAPDQDKKMVGLFSSGTTGAPKCIWNSFRHLVDNGIKTFFAFGLSKEEHLLMMAAPWHVAGLSWAIMAEELGIEYDFLTTTKGEQEKWYDKIKEVKPDVLLTVPGVLSAILNKDWFVPKLIFGGYAPGQDDLKEFAKHSEVMIQGYGQTEAGGLIARHVMQSSGQRFKNEHICCGLPISGVKVHCAGTPTKAAAIHIQSETAFVSNEYDSGDLGYKDSAGNIYIVGRADSIVSAK